METFNMLPPGLYSSSQKSDLGDEELSKMVWESEPATRKKSTSWGFKKFEHWMEKRSISVDLKTVDEIRLNELLRKFFAEVKSEKKIKPLTPSALTGIRVAISRTIKAHPTPTKQVLVKMGASGLEVVSH